MMRLLVLLVLLLSLAACVPQTKLAGRGCNAVLVAPTELVTAAHCLSPYGGGRTGIRDLSRKLVRATPSTVDIGRDVAHLTLAAPIYSPYYAVYSDPSLGTIGYVFGDCPYRNGKKFRVIATEREVGPDGVARWEWTILEGQIACPGDSGSPVWSEGEFGVYHGVLSRYQPLRTRMGDVLVTWKIGTSVYTGAGE